MSTEVESVRTEKDAYKRRDGVGIETSEAEIAGWVARFADLGADPDAFRDANDPSRRLKIMWAISPDNGVVPAAISKLHPFHMSYIESEPGHHPVLHFHEYA
ncbi:MAG: hypothetical protein EXQ97_06645 [Alphaproteobacteria bacterium]|nr:hypothetical protein [Alphaproteobacteria bacterium]